MKKVKNAPKSAVKSLVRNKKPSSKNPLENAKVEIYNSLSEAILGFNPGSIGTELSQVDTIFLNERWYLISNMRQVLSQMYVEHGLIQTVVGLPVDDALRGGVDIKSKQLSEEQVQDLQVELEQEDILNSVVGMSEKWNRLFGGAGILTLVEDQDPTEPLDIEAIGPDTKVAWRAVDMWELFWDKQNTEGFNMELQEQNYEFYSYYAKKLHKSRVMKLKGLTAPSFIRPRLRGWGFSIIESLVRSLNQHLKANNLVFEVLDEFKVDVFKLKNLANTLLSPQGYEQVHKRIKIANQQKNYQHAITMDSEDDFMQKELSFSGLAETMVQIRMQIASDLRMPLTKIFGISAAGFSSGEDDIENYNSMIESQVRSKMKFNIIKILEIMCQQKFGFVPDDLTVMFKPLRMLSSEQEENIKTQKFARAMQAKQAGEISVLEWRNIINSEDLLGIQLDTDEASLPTPDEAMASPDDEENMDKTKDGVGANNGDSAKVVAPVSAPKPKTQGKEAPAAKNSLEFDEAEFRADGGENQFSPYHKRQVDSPTPEQKDLMEKAKQESHQVYGEEKWQFILWCFKKLGGKLK